MQRAPVPPLLRRSHTAAPPNGGSDVSSALEALSAEELRSFLLDMLPTLDSGPRAQIEDALLRRAAKSGSGFRPKAPSQTAIAEVEGFAAAACRVGHAEPREVDEYLRHGVKASLAGDHQGARAIFAALLPPLAEGEIDLGQDEMFDEVLTADLHDCVARYVAAVYLTMPPPERAEAVLGALELLHGLTYWSEPVASLERAVGPLPGLDEFLPLWTARLERDKPPPGDWESERDRWLREAVARTEGSAGLERIARATKRPEAVSAWCDAVVKEGDWSKSLRTYEDAAEIVTSDVWRGDFLDGAALAALVLGGTDLTKKLEAAWFGAPSLLRLLRFLLAGEPPPRALRKRAAGALQACNTSSPRLLGVLHVVMGDVPAAAALLDKAPGLGWSSPDHPGHVLFPTFAWLLGGAPSETVRSQIAHAIHRPPAAELDFGLEAMGDESSSRPGKADDPRLPSPTLVQVFLRVRVHEKLTAKDRAAALSAMKNAAAARVAGVLGEKRRRHYEHAALLVACCSELEGAAGKVAEVSQWVGAIRQTWSRFPAFQEALRAALARAKKA